VGAKGDTPEVDGRYLNILRDTYSDTTNVKYTLSCTPPSKILANPAMNVTFFCFLLIKASTRLCVLQCFMTQYWRIVMVPGFPHERDQGACTHDSESPVYLLNLSPSDNLGWPDPHPPPQLRRWLYWSPHHSLRTDLQLPRSQPGAFALAAPFSGRVQSSFGLIGDLEPTGKGLTVPPLTK